MSRHHAGGQHRPSPWFATRPPRVADALTVTIPRIGGRHHATPDTPRAHRAPALVEHTGLIHIADLAELLAAPTATRETP